MHWSVERSLRGVGVGVAMVFCGCCRGFRDALDLVLYHRRSRLDSSAATRDISCAAVKGRVYR